MKTNLFLLLFLFLLITCQNPTVELGMAQDYFPDAKMLTDGIVNKYYSHYKFEGQQDTYTTIDYISYQWINAALLSKTYRPDLQPRSKKNSIIEQNNIRTIHEEWYDRRGDTLLVDVEQPVTIAWTNLPSVSEKTIVFDSVTTKTFLTTQQLIRDTLVLNKPAKIIEGKIQDTYITATDTTISNGLYKSVYGTVKK